MSSNNSDVVIVGGGISGIATAYFLGKSGVKSVVIERDSVGSHASGFAYGGLSPLSGVGIPGPLAPVALEGMRLHNQFAQVLAEETGVQPEYRFRASMALAFDEQEAAAAKAGLEWKQQQEGYSVKWVDAREAKSVEPRISDEAIGAVYIEGGADVEPYRLVLALTQAAEAMGAVVRHGTVTGLKREGGRISAVVLGNEEISCDTVVLATGPWSAECGSWLGIPIGIRPLKGQILRLRAPGAPFQCSIGWADNYATTKPDGLLWTGTTEEEAGFDENPTIEARDRIMASLLKMIPSLTDAQLVQQTACLRPLSSDGMPILGEVPGWGGVYMATGAGRKGILLSPAMASITTDLITKGESCIPLDAFDPARFS